MELIAGWPSAVAHKPGSMLAMCHIQHVGSLALPEASPLYGEQCKLMICYVQDQGGLSMGRLILRCKASARVPHAFGDA